MASILDELKAENIRLREALETKGSTQIYLDGFDAALEIVKSSNIHCDWGPRATPDDGLHFYKSTIVEVLERSRAKMGEK